MDISTAITLVLTLIDNLSRVSAVIASARAEGRSELSPDEWAGILAAADAARAALGVPPTAATGGTLGGALGAQNAPGGDVLIPEGT